MGENGIRGYLRAKDLLELHWIIRVVDEAGAEQSHGEA
jgi:hypothetical protein